MQFVVIGLDGTDSEAPARRQKVRQDHIAMGEKLLASRNLWYGAALLGDDGSMKGTMYVVSFPSERELHEWLDKEPIPESSNDCEYCKFINARIKAGQETTHETDLVS